MALLGAALIFTGVYRFKGELPWGSLGKIALTAGVVSLLEEALFRGAIFGLLRQSLTNVWALFFTSALFSFVHFLAPDEAAANPPNVHFLSGFALIPQLFHQFHQPLLVLAGFTTLFLVGWILGYTVWQTRSLWMAIGLHAGWIFGTMGFSKFTKRLRKDTLPVGRRRPHRRPRLGRHRPHHRRDRLVGTALEWRAVPCGEARGHPP